MEIEKAVIRALEKTDCPLYDPITRPDGIIPVIANLDQPEPRAPYLLISLINTTNIGLPYKSVVHNSIDVKEHIYQVKDYYVGLTLHASIKDESQQWFKHFENGVHSDMVDWAFAQNGFALVDSDSILYQPLPISGTAYRRAIMNITLRAEVEDSFTVNSLNRVLIEGYIEDSLKGYAGDVVADVTYPVI